MIANSWRYAWLLLGLAVLPACSTHNAQALRVQQEKEQLTEVIRGQREANAKLKENEQSLAKRLDEAEKELAVLQGRGTRFAYEPSSTKSSSPAPIREPADAAPSATAAKPAPDEKLPWRPSRTGSRPAANSPTSR